MRIGITPSSFAAKDVAPLELLKKYGVDIIENPYKRRLTEDEAFDFVKDLDGLIAGLEPLTNRVLDNGKDLKAIARVGIGMDNIDFDSAKRNNIKISNTPDGPTRSVAEMTVTALLTILKNIIPLNNSIHQKKWEKKIGSNIEGKKILFIGYGRIGQKTASLFSSFGTEIYVYDPFFEEEVEGITFIKDLNKALSLADVITFHASGREPIITVDNLSLIKKGTILLNSARGELIPEDVVIKGLDSEIFSAAWFDAFWKEPYQGPLCNYDNVILTPHTGTYTAECRLNMELNAVENILKDLNII